MIKNFNNLRAASSVKNMKDNIHQGDNLAKHLESWKGLVRSGVHVKEQTVDVGRRKVLEKLTKLNNMSSKQIEDLYRKNHVRSPSSSLTTLIMLQRAKLLKRNRN